MATPPGPWSWVPPDWLGGADVMPAPEMQFPDDGFSDVTPEALAAARAERDAETEMQFPPDDLALPEHSKPGPTGSARYEFPGWDPFASEAEQAAAFAANNEAAPVATAEQRAAIDAGQDPFAALRSPSPEQPYIGFPTNPDEAPAEATPAALDLPAEPDAITGAGGVPLAPLVPGLGIPEDMFQAAMRGVPMETQGTPELPAEYLTNEEAGIAYAMQSPERQLKQRFDLETRRDEFKREADAKARTADTLRAERIEENLYKSREMSRQKFAQIDAEAKAEAAREIDINRGWANASTGTKIAGIFSAFAGGLVAHKYGGKNSGLEMIDNLISRDIDAQKFSKQQRVNALATRGAAARDRRDMAESDAITDTRMRLAALDRIGAQIQADAQNFDPRGTTAIRYGEMFLDLAAKRAQVARDGEKRIADDYKEQLDLAGKELDLQKKQAELAKAQRAAMGGGGGGSGVSGKLTPDQWAAQYGEAGRPPSAMDAKEYKEWVVTGGKIATRASAQAEAETKNRENSPEWIAGELGAGDLVNEDGKPVLFRDATSAGRIAKKRGAVDTAARLIDQITAAREKYGWSSSLIKSKEYQDALADMGALIVAQKNDAELGALAAADMVLIEKMLGTTDPTEARDPTPGLKRARFNSINSLNEVIRSEARPGQKPKRYDIKAPNYEKPKETEEDRILARGLSSDVSSALAFAKDTENVEPSKRKAAPKSENELLEALKASGGIPPTIRAQLDKWEAEARSGDEKTSEKARAYLIEWSERGGSPQIRGAAETALFAANQGGVD